MTADRKIAAWRFCAAVPLIVSILACSLGAQSVGFHNWVHGDDDVECSLTHHRDVAKPSESESPNHSNGDHPDPLEPFCETGYLLQATPPDMTLFEPEVAVSSVILSSVSIPTKLPSLFHSRAPPALI